MTNLEFSKNRTKINIPQWLNIQNSLVCTALIFLLGGSSKVDFNNQNLVEQNNSLEKTAVQVHNSFQNAKNVLRGELSKISQKVMINGEPGKQKAFFRIGSKVIFLPHLPKRSNPQNLNLVKQLENAGKFTLDVNIPSITRQIKGENIKQPSLDLVLYLSQIFDSIHFSSLAEPSNIVMPADGSDPNPNTEKLAGKYMHKGPEHKNGVAVDVTDFTVKGKTYSALIGDNTRPDKINELIKYKQGDTNFVTDPAKTRETTKFFIKHLINFARIKEYDIRIILGRGYQQVINDPSITKMVEESNVKIDFMLEESAHYNHFHIDMKLASNVYKTIPSSLDLGQKLGNQKI